MATLLYRMGKFAYRKKWIIIATWLVVLIGAAGAERAFSAPMSDNFTIPGIEAQQAMDTVNAKFGTGAGDTGQLVFQAPNGQKVTAGAYPEAIETATAQAGHVTGVKEAISPFTAKTISPNETTAYTDIVLDAATPDQVGAATTNELQAVSAQAHKSGLTVALGGDAFSGGSSSGGGVTTEALGLLAALIVLAIAFRSLRTALLPVVTALVSVGVGTMGLLALSGVFTMNSTAPALGAMLGLAVGIDYALFIVSRHQNQVRAGMEPEESAGRAVATSGSAVVFAGASVVIALAALAVVNIPFLTVMGVGAAETVVIAVLVSVTLLPALLGLRGRRIVESKLFRSWAWTRSLGRIWARRPGVSGAGVSAGVSAGDSVTTANVNGLAATASTGDSVTATNTGGLAAATKADGSAAGTGSPVELKKTGGSRWVGMVTRFRWPAVAATVLALLFLAAPVSKMQLGLSQSLQGSSAEAASMIDSGFGPGFNGPLVLLVDGGSAASGTSAVSAATGASGTTATSAAATAATVTKAATTITDQLRRLPDVAYVAPAQPDAAGDATLVTVIPKSGPSDPATSALVNSIRQLRDPVQSATGTTIQVTGETAINIDLSKKLSGALPVYFGVVVGLALILLLLVFRSIAVPLKAMLGFVLSAGASLGATVAAFQWGWLAGFFGVGQTGQLLSLLPIMLLGVLFGLAMDYEVFLVSRMREEHVHGHGAQQCLHTGFRHGARVVTAAALIMVSVFSSFIFSNQQMIKPMAFAFAIGILCDAFLVRMTLVPAVLSLLGRAAWWLPGWLGRLLPHVDIEGAKLSRPALALDEADDERRREPVHATTTVRVPHPAEGPIFAAR
jgi:putative drug exporter of the RND superfamily